MKISLLGTGFYGILSCSPLYTYVPNDMAIAQYIPSQLKYLNNVVEKILFKTSVSSKVAH